MPVLARGTTAFTALVVAAALVTGCGGGSPEQKADDAYASSVCTTIGSWLVEVKSVDTHPFSAGVTKASIEARLNRFEVVTRQFVARLKAVPAPSTSDGRAARKKIDLSPLIPGAQGEIGSAKSVESTVATARSSTAAFEDALGGWPDFQTLKPIAQSLLTFLRSGRGSLASAFKTEGSCEQLG